MKQRAQVVKKNIIVIVYEEIKSSIYKIIMASSMKKIIIHFCIKYMQVHAWQI